jgi:hypothetical protein
MPPQCLMFLSAAKQDGKVRGISSCSCPSFHMFASDTLPLITRSRVSYLLNDRGSELAGAEV